MAVYLQEDINSEINKLVGRGGKRFRKIVSSILPSTVWTEGHVLINMFVSLGKGPCLFFKTETIWRCGHATVPNPGVSLSSSWCHTPHIPPSLSFQMFMINLPASCRGGLWWCSAPGCKQNTKKWHISCCEQQKQKGVFYQVKGTEASKTQRRPFGQ